MLLFHGSKLVYGVGKPKNVRVNTVFVIMEVRKQIYAC